MLPRFQINNITIRKMGDVRFCKKKTIPSRVESLGLYNVSIYLFLYDMATKYDGAKEDGNHYSTML